MLSGNSNVVSHSYCTMGLPARKRVATQIFHDNVQNGHVRLRLRDVPLALEVCC